MKKRCMVFALALALLLTLLPVEALAASSSAKYNGHTYQRIDKGMTWKQAKAYCESLGGHLATITSAKEQAVIQKLVKAGSKAQYWLGGTDEAEEGEWAWVTGEPWNYRYTTVTFDNYQGIEHYLQMQRHHWGDTGKLGVWNDINNENHINGEEEFFSTEMVGLICEFEPDGDSAQTASSGDNVLWTNYNKSGVKNGARKGYVTFELPACTVTEIETYHYKSGSKAPGEIMLVGKDGSEYGPYQAKGGTGQGGVKNALWIAKVNITLPAGTYAVCDSDPDTWSNNSGSDGWGFAVVRGSKTQSGKTSAASGSTKVRDLWTNYNAGGVQNNAKDYYVMFDLPDCTVTELETYHYKSGGKAPGELMLYGEYGSEYGPFKCKGAAGQGGVKNAHWIATVNLKLPAGKYAIADSDPDTWSNNSGSGGWGFAVVRGYTGGTVTAKPAATPKPAASSKRNYTVTVTTGSDSTDEDVYVTFYGSDGSSSGTYQIDNEYDNFEAGVTDRFTVAAADVGTVAYVDVTYKQPGSSDSWSCTGITVDGVSFSAKTSSFTKEMTVRFYPGTSAAKTQTSSTSSWTGTWDSTFNDMHLTQSGSRVTGYYGYDNGVIEATASGNTLRGTWREDGNQVGRFVFTMSPDGKTFTGTWGYGDSETGSSWTGTRK